MNLTSVSEVCNSLMKRFFVWRMKHISEKNFLLILSFVVGLLVGLAAVLLKNTVHATYLFFTSSKWFNVDIGNPLFLFYPMIGITLTVLFLRIFIKDNIGHGISRVLFAISRRKAYIKPHNMYSSMIASTLTVGLGGSVGLEAPIVYTGSAIGSNLGRFFRINYKQTLVLIGCGAAGAIAGIFKAPIAGILFVFEVLLLDLTMTTAIPLLISSITASMVSFFFLGHSVQFSFNIQDPFLLNQIPFYIVLGIFGALVSLYFLRMSSRIEKFFSSFKKQYTKILTGGLSLGFLIFLFPSLFGEGYDALNGLLHGNTDAIFNNSFFYNFRSSAWIGIGVIVLIILFKVIATACTTGSGGVGGTFAPSLFLGGLTGFLVATLVNTLGIAHLSPANFTLVGMAAVMTGVMHSPLTAIFLIAEITGGYGLFAPLMISALISYLVVHSFEKYSIYTKELADKNILITHDKDKSAWQLMDIKTLIEDNFIVLNEDDYFESVISAIEVSQRNLFPVLNNEKEFVGLVVMDNIRPILFKPELYKQLKISELMLPKSDDYCIDINSSMLDIVNKFKSSDTYNLAVLDNNKYIGFISRANSFSAYRKFVSQFSEE